MSEGEVFVFGCYRLDTAQGVVLRDGEPVPIVPKAVALLGQLLRQPGRVLQKRELIETLWPDVIVEEANLAKLVFLLRQELGEDVIETVPKRGYRFAEPVTSVPLIQSDIVAVLPFVDLSEGKSEGSLCEGLSEEILNRISQLPQVKVVARTSSFRMAGADVRDVGRNLSASLLVEGSVRKSRDDLRITARLVDTRTGLQRWSAVFERPLRAVFAVQDEIAAAVAKNVHAELPAQSSRARQPIDPEAYRLYLQGRYHWNRRPGEEVARALRCFEQAIEKEPGFAAAWAGVADIHATLGSWESGVLEPKEAERKAKESAAHALALDPDLADAHTTLAYTALHYHCDTVGAEQKFRRALALNPNYAAAHHWYSHCLVAAGRFDEALSESGVALALDPMNVLLSVHLAWHHHMAREHDLVMRQAERVVQMEPHYHWGHYFLAWGAEALGETGRAVTAMRAAVDFSGNDPVMIAGLARAQAAAGGRKDALSTLGILENRRNGRELFAYEEALVWLALGEPGRALDLLERALNDRSGWMAYLEVDPRLDPIRADRRFAALRYSIDRHKQEASL